MTELYSSTIYPLELIYKYIYLILHSVTANYGLALLALSLLNYFLLIPLNRLVAGIQDSENNIQSILKPQLQLIKETSRGDMQHHRIRGLYERYSYHPIYAIRLVFPLLVQIPFLMAVYFMVSNLPYLQGVNFLFIKDLAKPDAILFGYNIMPVIMTLISLFNACYVVKLSKQQRNQAILVALLFFILLYNAPSGLLIYWTANNILIFAFNLINKLHCIKHAKFHLSKIKQHALPSIINSSGLLLGLSFITPLYFTLSLNINIFRESQIVNFFVFIIIIICSFILISIALDKIIQKYSNSFICFSFPFKVCVKEKTNITTSIFKVSVKNIFYLLIACTAAYFLTVLCLNLKLYISSLLLINCVRISTIVAIFFIIAKFNFKILNLSLLSILIFCCLQFAQSHTKLNIKTQEIGHVIERAHNSFPIDEKLINKPNIYLIYLESYINSKALENTYGYDNSSFENALLDKGFDIYDDVYSHSAFTKGSLLSLMLMESDVSPFFIGNSDVINEAHDIFSGNEQNVLFKYMKKNGYLISCYFEIQPYYFTQKGKYIDFALKKVDTSYLSVLGNLSASFGNKIGLFSKHILKKPSIFDDSNFFQDTHKHIANIPNVKQPSFFIIKPPNALHFIHRSGEIVANYQNWIASNIYQKGVSKTNTELLELINAIDKSDPNALVILLGDHGNKYLPNISQDVITTALYDIKSRYPQSNMTSQHIIEDLFSVFLAIKMPKDVKNNIVVDSQFAYADLFKYIFAALDNNPVFIENKSVNVSMNNEGVLFKQGDVIYDTADVEQ